jgi:hypothetical protein
VPPQRKEGSVPCGGQRALAKELRPRLAPRTAVRGLQEHGSPVGTWGEDEGRQQQPACGGRSGDVRVSRRDFAMGRPRYGLRRDVFANP